MITKGIYFNKTWNTNKMSMKLYKCLYVNVYIFVQLINYFFLLF